MGKFKGIEEIAMLNLPILPAFQQNNLAITMQTSDFFAPYASVTALSIIEHSSPEYNYDIVFMTWDMKKETERKLVSMADDYENVSVRVVNVADELTSYQNIAKTSSGFSRFSFTGMIRLLIPQMLDRYRYILNLDCDMLFLADVSEVFQYDISNVCMAAVPELFAYVLSHRPEERLYTEERFLKELGLRSVGEYINGGFLFLNLEKIRERYTVKQIMNFAVRDGKIFRNFEQDIFSKLFQDEKILLPMTWNWLSDMPRLVGRYEKYLPADDAHLLAYQEAEAHVKNIHYQTDKKPWLTNIACPHSKEWWKVAIRSPFLQDFPARATKGNLRWGSEIEKSESPHLLFYCTTSYQLLNAMNIKFHYYRNDKADILITNEKMEREYKQTLINSGVFSNVFSYIQSKNYTDYFVPDCGGTKMNLFFDQICNSEQITVHIYEGGGCGVYTQDLSKQVKVFEGNLLKQIKDVYLYTLEVHSNYKNPYPLIKIPQVNTEDDAFITLLNNVFGMFELPEEQYIFLQESFAEEGLLCDDSRLLDSAAEVVGVKNLAVRLHPKAEKVNEKLYRLHGYKTYLGGQIPFELALLSPKLENKVLLSVSSTALVAPWLMGESNAKVISLFELMPLSHRIKASTDDYRRFLNKMCKEANKDHLTMFCPKTLAELRAVIRYIEGDCDG